MGTKKTIILNLLPLVIFMAILSIKYTISTSMFSHNNLILCEICAMVGIFWFIIDSIKQENWIFMAETVLMRKLLDTKNFFNLIYLSLVIFCGLFIQSDRINGLVLFFNLAFTWLIIRLLNISLDHISFHISLMLMKSF